MVSIIELVVYGMITYGTLLFIILTTMNKIEIKHDYSILRLAFIMPALILSLVLGNITPDIILFEETIITNSTIITTSETKIVIENSIWFYVHLVIFSMLFFYGILNAFGMLFKKD